MTWPHSHGSDSRLADGTPLSADELEIVALDAVFVLCEACKGAGGECECDGTGFDWSDTCDVRATLAALVAASQSEGV